MIQDLVWHIKFYGVRGSTPVCDHGFQKFGGNTTCIYTNLLINDSSDLVVIFDAGTGIRKLGREMKSGILPDSEFVVLVFTHFHWDHIQGLPFFESAYNENKKLAFFSPHSKLDNDRLKRIFEIQTQQIYFPVQLNSMGAKMRFSTEEKYLSDMPFDERVNFTYRMHQHPGGAFSFRVEAEGRSVVICTDLEHGEEIDQEVVEFCRNADLLIHDAQYTEEELKTHRGWGHSSYEQAIACAEQAGAKQLIFTHHDPDHDDDFLTHIEKKYQAVFPNCALAKEGMEIFV
ncbi:MAG: MBL fold metallo-hydrolase [Bacteroidota bacterium]